MNLSIKTFSISLFAVLALAAHERPAHALQAEGDIDVPGSAHGGAMATFDLCTFSEQTQTEAAGPNAMHEGFKYQFAPPPNSDPTGTDIPPSVCPTPDNFVVDMRPAYGPKIVGFRHMDKPRVQAAGNTNLTNYESTSGFYKGSASQLRRPPGLPNGKQEISIRAEGERDKKAPPESMGRAAGQAIDPFSISPGVYDYVQIIGSILLQTDREGDFAGVDMFAFDSRFSEPLWGLQIFVEGGPITAVRDIKIDFISNPILGLTDDVIESNVLSAFDVSNGIANLTSFELFDTTYPVDQTILFTTGVEAAVEDVTVPEASPLSLLALGTLGAASTLKRKLKSSKPSEKETTKVS